MKIFGLFLMVILGQLGCLSPSIRFNKERVKLCDHVPEVLINFVKGDMEADQFFAWRKDELGQSGDAIAKAVEDLEIGITKVRSKRYKWEFSRSGKCDIKYANKDILLIRVSPKDPFAFFSRLFDEVYILNRESGKVLAFFKIKGQYLDKIMVEHNILYIASTLDNQPTQYYCIQLIK